MFFRITCLLVFGLLISCSTMQMKVDPDLELVSEKFQITEKPGILSKGNLVFGLYKATNIDRSFATTTTSSSFIGARTERTKQTYSYHFEGKNNWNGRCRVRSGHAEFKRMSGGYYAGLHCTFQPEADRQTSASRVKFSIAGGDLASSNGSIKIGKKTFSVYATNRIDGSALTLERATGYHFYSGDHPVAGVSVVNSEGPVWLGHNLSADEKDMIALIIVALLLNQT